MQIKPSIKLYELEKTQENKNKPTPFVYCSPNLTSGDGNSEEAAGGGNSDVVC